jgi:hypothetical protein
MDRRRCGGGVYPVALGAIACNCNGAFEGYDNEEGLVEEAVYSRVLLSERGEKCSL